MCKRLLWSLITVTMLSTVFVGQAIAATGTVDYKGALGAAGFDHVSIGGVVLADKISPFVITDIPADVYPDSDADFKYPGGWDNWRYTSNGWYNRHPHPTTPVFFVDPGDPNVLTTLHPGTVEYNDALVNGVLDVVDIAGNTTYSGTSAAFTVGNIPVTNSIVQVHRQVGGWDNWKYSPQGWSRYGTEPEIPMFFVDPDDPSLLTTLLPGTVKYNDAQVDGVLDHVVIGGVEYGPKSDPFTIGNIPATGGYQASYVDIHMVYGGWDNWVYSPQGWVHTTVSSVPIFFVDPDDPSVLTTMPPGTVEYNDALGNAVLTDANIGGVPYGPTSEPFTVGNIPATGQYGVSDADFNYSGAGWDNWRYGPQGWENLHASAIPIFFIDPYDPSVLKTMPPGTVAYRGALGEAGFIYVAIGGVVLADLVSPFTITGVPANNSYPGSYADFLYPGGWDNWMYGPQGWLHTNVSSVPIFFVDPDDSSILTTIFVLIAPRILDINPGTLNMNSKGKWITAYISGGNFELIDAASLELEGVAADTTEGRLVDLDGNGDVDVYMAKFPRDIVSSGLSAGRDVELSLTGTVNSGEVSFTLTDMVDVISGGRNGSHGKSVLE